MSRSSESIRVLHVDDEPDFADMVAAYLEREEDRLSVVTATSAAEGVDKLTDGTFDCIVSDYDMPGLDGIAFLNTVREEHPDLPFILYTGKGSEEVASDALRLGATDYLQKDSGREQYELLANRVQNAVEQYRSERAVESTQRRFQTLIEEASDVIAVVDADGQFDYLSHGTDRILGYAPESLLGKSGFDYVHPDDFQEAMEQFGTLIEDPDRRPSVEFRFDHADGSWQWLEVRARNLLDDPVIDGVVVYARDVTERKARERDLARLQTIIEALGDPVYVLDAEGYYTFVNNAFVDATKYPREDIIGEHVSKFVPEPDRQRGQEIIRELLRSDTHQTVTWEHERITADGARVPVENHLALLPTENGEFRGTAGVLRDITERRQREERLDALHEATRALMRADTQADILTAGSDAMSAIADFETNSIRLYDPEADALTLAHRSEQSKSIIGPSLGPYPVYDTPAGRAYTSGELVIESVEPDDPYGRDPLTESAYVPLGEHGVFNLGTTATAGLDREALAIAEILAANLTAALDLHERQQQFQEREEQLAALLKSSRDLVVAPTVEDIGETASDAVEAIFGLSVNAIRLYDTETDSLVPRIVTTSTERVVGNRPAYDVESSPAGRAYRTGETVRSPVEPDDPYDRDPLVESLYIPLGEHGVLSVGAFSADEFDEPTVQMAEIFAANIEATLDRVDQERRLESLHEATRELVLATTAEEVAERTAEAAKEVLGYANNVVRLVDSTGTRLRPVAVTAAARSELGERPVYTVGEGPVGEVYERGEPQIIDDVRTVDDGYDRGEARAVMFLPIGEYGTLGIGETSVGVFERSDLQLASILAATTGTVLDRVERERELQRQNDRLEEFAGVVSHDLRNPLNVAAGRLAMVSEDCDSEHLDDVSRAHSRMEALIDDLLTLAREGREITSLEHIELSAVVEDCWRSVDTANASLRVETDQSVLADRSRLQQLLENLVRNAIEHGGNDVAVAIGNLDGGFYVEDDGTGIPADKREDAFEAGYTTAEDGTGLGLNIVEDIAEAHGWAIRVSESDAGGARFEITEVTPVEG